MFIFSLKSHNRIYGTFVGLGLPLDLVTICNVLSSDVSIYVNKVLLQFSGSTDQYLKGHSVNLKVINKVKDGVF